MPESRLFFMYMALSAALGCIMGPGALAVVAAAAAFGFACFFAAKAPDVERARIAKPITMFFMFAPWEVQNTHDSAALRYRRAISFPTAQKRIFRRSGRRRRERASPSPPGSNRPRYC